MKKSAFILSMLSLLGSLCGCGGGGGSSSTPPSAPTVSSITVSPQTVTLIAGQTQQLTATANYSNGSTQDVTSTVGWSSSNSAVATVSASGLAASLTAGQANISAQTGGGSVTGAAILTVTAPTLSSIQVSPTIETLGIGVPLQYSATGTYSNASVGDISNSATWTSSAPAVATVSSTGFVTPVAAGTATITATSGTFAGQASLTVPDATGGAVLVDDITDSRIFITPNSDGSILTFLGTRDSSGNPTSLYEIKRTAPDGTWQTISVDSEGRPTAITLSDNSQFLLNWTSSTSAIVTGISGDGTTTASVTIGSTSSGATNNEAKALKQKKTAGVQLAQAQTTITPSDWQIVANVTSCGVPEAWAQVELSPGEIDASQTLFGTTGTYQASVPSGPLGSALNNIQSAAQALPASFCSYVNNVNQALNEGSATGPVGALTIQSLICAGLSASLPPASPLVASACGLLSVAMNFAVGQACTINAGSNSVFNYVVKYYDQQNTYEIEAGLVGNPPVTQTVAPTSPGVFPPVNIELGCPQVDHVSVTPDALSLSVGQGAPLWAAAYNKASPPEILRSSAFTFLWNASAATGVASIPQSFSYPGGSVAAVQGVATGGPVPITATELSSAKQGTANVTVTPPTVKTYIGISNISSNDVTETLTVNGKTIGTVAGGPGFCYGVWELDEPVGTSITGSVVGTGGTGNGELDFQMLGYDNFTPPPDSQYSAPDYGIWPEYPVPFQFTATVAGCNGGGDCTSISLPSTCQ